MTSGSRSFVSAGTFCGLCPSSGLFCSLCKNALFPETLTVPSLGLRRALA